MAIEEHIKLLKKGSDVWNDWRKSSSGQQQSLFDKNSIAHDYVGHGFRNAGLRGADLRLSSLNKVNLRGLDLEGADLSHADLANADCCDVNFCGAKIRGTRLYAANLGHAALACSNLHDADLREANLCNAVLNDANAIKAMFSHANLRGASLVGTDLRDADLSCTDLTGANLTRSNLQGGNLYEADLSNVILHETNLGNVDLTTVKGLDSCDHRGPSNVDHRTLRRSRKISPKFWQGCGLTDLLIDYLPSLAGDVMQFYTCFISYSSLDQEFADRLYSDLQSAGVRCWFAPHDLPIGAKTWDGIDEAIRTRDKVLLILSEAAIASDWVEDEVTTAFAEERRRDKLVLFPVRLDDVVMKTEEPWAGKLRDNRNIGNFSEWKDHDIYRATFKRVLRDLKADD